LKHTEHSGFVRILCDNTGRGLMSCNTDLMSMDVRLLVLMIVIAVMPAAWARSEYTTLHRFTDGKDGGFPIGSLIFDGAGNLYGTTGEGGAYGWGTVFELSPNVDGSWTESVLYSFCSAANCSDGREPGANVILDGAGDLYGTTVFGGSFGGGVVFRLRPAGDGRWKESVLYSFCSATNCSDGNGSDAGLVFDGAGDLYGTTVKGGAFGGGVVFKLRPAGGEKWKESVLYSFCSAANCSDGSEPGAGVIFDGTGNLYGTTGLGGALGWGVAFELIPTEIGVWKEKVLHHFRAGADGADPFAGLIFDAAGNLYGTTSAGGNCKIAGPGCGVIFKLTPAPTGVWREKILHRFEGRDGWGPTAGLIFDASGTLYGTTTVGGDLTCRSGYGCGVVFKVKRDSNDGWSETVLHDFSDRPGALPWAGLVTNAAGKLYGTTEGDSPKTFGSVFEIMP
jgi:uncharacterized repeat protein (TIGR03803 family)